jgi:oligopeptide/dipeptide ABC transporter ATP-binding protein
MVPTHEPDPPATAVGGEPLLEVREVSVHFPTGHRLAGSQQWIRAVDGVTLSVMRGETLAVVGESGCGKTTLGRAMVMLQPPTAGKVSFAGIELTNLRSRGLRAARRHLQMIFQDPYGSLDPRQPVEEIVAEPLLIRGVAAIQRHQRVAELLDLVGLGTDAAPRLPREFSGGQRQRIGIARALAADPKLIVCDEPLSALDVSIQAQIINLLLRLQLQFDLTYVFISHDLAVVRQMADRVAVLYLGAVVEIGETRGLFETPRHPYTMALLSAVPTLSSHTPSAEAPVLVAGDPPSPTQIPSGCRFHPRCWLRDRLGKPDICLSSTPALSGSNTHQVACHFAAELAGIGTAASNVAR